jgi:uncharacterized protein DUF1837
MIQFLAWCDAQQSNVGGHSMTALQGRVADLAIGRDAIADLVPGHYASEEHIARVLERLGKNAAAAFVREKLPTSKSMRSGDLGEILATEYIAEQTDYAVPIKRLRWKDHRNMAMRGDDVIGIAQDANTGRLRFLKTESKSRANFLASVVAQARSGLDKDNGMPSAHALSFISERLVELGNSALADAIDDAQLKDGIAPQNVKHLLFAFSGNSATDHLSAALQAYGGGISQLSVGLRIENHGDFVGAVYDLVMQNADLD